MARPKTEFRNKLKTRVTDPTYDGVQRYMTENHYSSEARAISELLEPALFGTVGSVPQSLVHSSPEIRPIWDENHFMKNGNQIMGVELPTPEAADLTIKAAQHGVSTAEFLGIQVLTAAYGVFHPLVAAFRNRSKPGINGPETQGDQE